MLKFKSRKTHPRANKHMYVLPSMDLLFLSEAREIMGNHPLPEPYIDWTDGYKVRIRMWLRQDLVPPPSQPVRRSSSLLTMIAGAAFLTACVQLVCGDH